MTDGGLKSLRRMPSSVMLRLVALVKTDTSEERSASIIRVTRIGELGTKLSVTSNRRTLRRNYNIVIIIFLCSLLQSLVTANVVPSSLIIFTLMMDALYSSETSVLANLPNIPEDGNPYSHRRQNLKLTGWAI
jgi:hypothetical protein